MGRNSGGGGFGGFCNPLGGGGGMLSVVNYQNLVWGRGVDKF